MRSEFDLEVMNSKTESGENGLDLGQGRRLTFLGLNGFAAVGPDRKLLTSCFPTAAGALGAATKFQG